MGEDQSIRRFVKSLHFKIASGVIGTVIFLSAVQFAWEYHFYRNQLISELRLSAESVSDVTLNSLLELAMVGRHPEMLQGGVERLSRSSPHLRTISILDLAGVVRFSSEKAWIGRRLNRNEPGCIVCHEGPGPPGRSAFFESKEGRFLRYAAPIPNRTGCHTCHDPAQALVGILLVDHTTLEVQQKLRASLQEMIVKAATTVLAILVVLGLLLNRIVISRLKRLTEATSQVTTDGMGALNLESLSRHQDELGHLARSFEDMAGQIQSYCGQLEEKERIRVSLLQRLVETQEEERKTISRELHDQLGQSLSALLLAFQTSSGCWDAPSGEHARTRAEIEARIRSLIEDVHQLAWQMRPSILDDYGLERALHRYVEEVSKNSKVSIDFHHTSPEGAERLPNWIETTLYRVAQEGVTNVLRHSKATQCSLVLIRNRSSVTLLIEDNGIGFDPDRIEPTSERGLGILGMRERVLDCGGSFDLESAPTKGTTVRAKIPLEEGPRWQSE